MTPDSGGVPVGLAVSRFDVFVPRRVQPGVVTRCLSDRTSHRTGSVPRKGAPGPRDRAGGTGMNAEAHPQGHNGAKPPWAWHPFVGIAGNPLFYRHRADLDRETGMPRSS